MFFKSPHFQGVLQEIYKALGPFGVLGVGCGRKTVELGLRSHCRVLFRNIKGFYGVNFAVLVGMPEDWASVVRTQRTSKL